MEESEKRRERLRAMRMEAQIDSTTTSSSSSQQPLLAPPSLSNPLLENPQENSQPSAQRFGFYTDPMAAFSSDKRRNTGQQQFAPRPQFPHSPAVPGPKNPEMPGSGVHQFQNNYSPYQTMHQGGDPYYSPGPSSSPMGIRSPYPVHQGSPGLSSAPGGGHWVNNSPSPGPGPGGSPYPMHQGSPGFNSAPDTGRGQWLNNNPGPRPGPGGSPYPMHQGSPGFNAAPGTGRGQWLNNNPGPGPGPGGSPYPVHPGSPNFMSPQGRGHWYNNSPGPSVGCGGGPSPNIGRGRGRWNGSGMSPGSRHSCGRGRGSYFGGQAWSFYDKSMVEDPWESLTAVIWQGQPAAQSNWYNRGSVQKTPIAKKPRVAQAFDTSNSKQSLAEYLSSSFEEAVEDAAPL